MLLWCCGYEYWCAGKRVGDISVPADNACVAAANSGHTGGVLADIAVLSVFLPVVSAQGDFPGGEPALP